MSSIFTILVSILSSSLAASIISAAIGEQKDRWVFRRDRIEEIYLNAERFCKELGIIYMLYFKALDNQISYNGALDLINRNKDRDLEAFSKLTLRIKMYEPSLLQALLTVERYRDELAVIESAGRAKYKEIGSAEEFAAPLRRKIVEFESFKNQFLSEIVLLGAAVARQPGAATSAIENFKEIFLKYFSRLIRLRPRLPKS